MMTGTAVAIRPTSVSFCIIFLMRPWPGGKQEDEMFSDAHLRSRVYGFTKHKKLGNTEILTGGKRTLYFFFCLGILNS